MQPFLKWAGGKRWLLQRHPELRPTSYERYIEPFLGGGAFFFSTSPAQAILSDLNEELINVYRAIKKDYVAVEQGLREHHFSHSAEHYYAVRASKPEGQVERAVRMLYLNRTCWNGLYRVNKKGEFNVPIGSKTNVLLSDDFKAIAQRLKGAELVVSDFEKIVDRAADGDFVFVDPPYTVHHNNNGFLKYNQDLFSWEDQIRLRDAVVRASERGAKVLVTNAAHESLLELYAGVGDIREIDRASVISGARKGRGRQKEILVRF